MAASKSKILFLDDEESIRLTLGMYLEDQGFSVTTAGTVPEALKLITQQPYDVLLADLNVGHPGDGFTVVSAMRRIHPRAVTFILTGYPAFETALEAIRLQVDDYVTKPADNDALVEKIREKLSKPMPRHPIEPKRLSEIISANIVDITQDWLVSIRKDPELARTRLSDAQYTDHVPRVLEAALKVSQGKAISGEDLRAARDHGALRRKQGYAAPLMIRESRLLHDAIATCLRVNLLAVEISYLIMDLISIHRTQQVLLEESVAAFLAAPAKGKKAGLASQVQRAFYGAAFGLNLLLQQSNGIDQLLRPGRAAGDVDIDRDHLVYALYQRVIVEHAA
jgi:ActR/RegA family two-component response regulator